MGEAAAQKDRLLMARAYHAFGDISGMAKHCILLGLFFVVFHSCRGDGHRMVPPAMKQDTVSRNEKNSAPVIRVMSYNVLRYGDGCQGPDKRLHQYLRRIIRYVRPDMLGLLKVASVSDRAPAGFADSILSNALSGIENRHYEACPFTNKSEGKDINLLFYNSGIFGCAGMETLVSDITDFNLYRLYDKRRIRGSDTALLYVVLLHTESGDKSKDRDRQLTELADALHRRFQTLPDVLLLGDFNLRRTSEKGYAALTQTGDKTSRFCDPPFVPDKTISYPADWEENPEPYSRFLTTSTRKEEDQPNDCGTGGGAKFWYDHILLSPAVAEQRGRYAYVPGSFRVIGNDGGRIGHAVSSKKHPNRAVPEDVAEALYQFSNKYPVMLELSPKD
jgi:endonuclease/exonuclease/phosphatase family metal-dependent hydrolase